MQHRNSLLQLDDNSIIAGGKNVISIVNISNDTIVNQIKNNEINKAYSLMKLRDGNILCGFKNRLICIYDIKFKIFLFNKFKIHDAY